MPDNEIPDNEIPDNEIPDNEIPDSEIPDSEIPDSELFDLKRGRENREHTRFDVTAYIDYAGSEILLYHRIENISLGGICLQTSSVEDLGTVVDMVINFPDLDDATISVRGEVVWINREPPMDMGIRFTDLDEDRRKVLREYLTRVRRR